MSDRCFFFAGGGTGGHIYPAIAVAEQIAKIEPTARIHFFCSTRPIDGRILGQTHFDYRALPAKGFSVRPRKLIDFYKSFRKSYSTAKEVIGESWNSVVVGSGGFVSAPVCWAAHKCRVPVALINVDIVPGRANRLITRWADEVFVQFEETARYFARPRVFRRESGRRAGQGKSASGRLAPKVSVVGCPLRSGFANPQPDEAIRQLGLDSHKKILLVTGASSGSQNINSAVCALLEKLDAFAEDWQVVHLAGQNNYERVYSYYRDVKIQYKVLSYFDDMANLLAAADVVIGRSGAVSVAEYAAAAVPSICIPYPYHKDRHQYLNAGKLVEVGAAVIVDDVPDEKDQAEWLWEELQKLMEDQKTRQVMAEGGKIVANRQAELKIAETLLEMASNT
ncbi:MAG: UDP-N-acetylglucosamine--N-acetylmuramyl-(pentapeptide) pyrophosphoryl-undecaprenol N-acetylglucosamine transferase [Phycisphaerales bacterium]|nr:MAG: UDP-N-acetylglucosamine--N-acetylmuramyl-(pentapeptide) pyrophosphoryl-undecaprenol N-acetylglucosamine transferase [Phycisphaerales bacterium]